MLAFAQATKHDYGKVLVTFQKMRREVHALVVESTEMRSSKYVGSLYFRILYHIANLHYYMEHDNRGRVSGNVCIGAVIHRGIGRLGLASRKRRIRIVFRTGGTGREGKSCRQNDEIYLHNHCKVILILRKSQEKKENVS